MISDEVIRQAQALDARARTGQRVRITCRFYMTGWAVVDDTVQRAIAWAVELAMAAAPGWTLEGVGFPVRGGVRVCEIVVRRTS